MRKEIRIKGVDLTTVFKLDNGHGIEASGKSCFYVMSYLKQGFPLELYTSVREGEKNMEQFSEKILKALGEWEIVKFLGAGQYGKVYEIQRKDFGTVYRAALKIISIPSSAEEVREIKSAGMSEAEISNYFEGIVEDFVREFALMAKLKGHTNIVGYEDHQVIPDDDGFGWTILIRMELLSSLTEYVTEKQMTRRDVTRWELICARRWNYVRESI